MAASSSHLKVAANNILLAVTQILPLILTAKSLLLAASSEWPLIIFYNAGTIVVRY